MKKKVIKITLTLQGAEESFTAEGSNRISSSGLAISTVLNYGNGALAPTAEITAYGLPISTMNKLFRVQWNTMQSILNTVKIEAGEQGSELSVIYEGNITFATINLDAAPNVTLVITSQMAVVEKMQVVEPFIVEDGQTVDAASSIERLTKEMGYEFQNFGASHQLVSTTINGSRLDQIRAIADMCDFDLYIEQKLIVICKRNGDREIKIPILSPSTSLIGYPKPDTRGVSFSCIYNPMVRFGGVVTIKDSIIEINNGDWRVYGMVATLEANIPQGKWQIDANATWRDSKDAAVQR